MVELTGQTFAGYEIIAKLGEGGFGAVYKARQPNLNRLVALKILAPHLAADAEFVARFKREATLAASFNHPNLVLVYAAGESDGTDYMAMEFVEGETLRRRIEEHGRLEPREALAIAVYVAQALQYAWNKSHLIHRDIKPDNVFLSKAGEVKVGDLGLAKNVGQSTAGMTATGMMMGSPHYISPEQARGLKEIDFRADIYSLGCTLYHMLTGRLPYEGSDPMTVMGLHVNAPPPAMFKVWPQCPMPLALLVGKMLKKNPRERHASYDELIAELTAVHDKIKAAQTASAAPPSGTITFLFTDIEGSTQLWEKHPQAMPVALERHNQILRRTMESHGGFVFKTVGDAFCVAFASAPNAMAAALAAQRALAAELWGETGPLRVRMALHTGAAEERGGDYFGPTLNRVARVLAAGHGGQILLSNATEQLVRDHLAEGVSLGDLGERSLKNLTRTERIFQINLPDLPTQFPTLRSAAGPSTTRRRRQRIMIYVGAAAGVLVLLIGLLLWSPWKTGSALSPNAITVDDAFIAEVAKCSPANQVRQVTEKLRQLNPDFNGRTGHKVEDGQVTELSLSGEGITDLSPMRALKALRTLRCNSVRGKSSLEDLSPLKGMQLENLEILHSNVTDLSPLKGMPLHQFNCQFSKVSDLGVLHGMPLISLKCSHSAVRDLSPLEGMLLTNLDIHGTPVSDLSPIKTMQLKSLSLDFKPERDAEIVRSIKSLNNINWLPVAEFWKRVEAGSVPPGCNLKGKAGAAAHQIAVEEEPAAAATSTGENWQDWMAERRKSGKIPDGFKDDGGTWVKSKPGGLTQLTYFMRDGAARATFTLPDREEATVALDLRWAKDGGTYQAAVMRESVFLYLAEPSTSGRSVNVPRNLRSLKTLKSWPLPANVDPNQEITLEFRAVGNELSIKINGQLLGTVRDTTYNREGEVAFYPREAGTRISRIEVLNLDGASTGENWQDWMAEQRKSGEIPGSFKDDGGVWEKTKPGGVVHLAHFMRDGAARAAFTLPDKEQALASLDLRWAKDGGTYQAAVMRQCVLLNLLEPWTLGKPRTSRNVKLLQRWPLPPSVDPNQKMTLEFRAVGDELSIKVNDQLIGTFRDSTYNREGEAAFNCRETGTRISGIEVLYLDGVSSTPITPKASVSNLLALVNVPRDVVKGNWTVTAEGLAVEKSNGATVLELPYDLPEEYDFEIEFTPQGEGLNVNQYISAAGHSFVWKLNSHGVSPPLYGFELLDGKFAKDLREAAVRKPMLLEPGKRYTSKIEVRRGRLRALVNGEEYVKWSGDFSRFSMEAICKLKDDRHLGLGAYRRAVVFHRAEMREVASTGGTADTFIREVAALQAEQQVARVVAKLKELNPGYDGQEKHRIVNGTVLALYLTRAKISDFSPVQALTNLITLNCYGTYENRLLSDLSALKGLRLRTLTCIFSRVSDLSPLRGMPLTTLHCGDSNVSDLSPLQGIQLHTLTCNNSKIRDLSPLTGMPLTNLACNATAITDLSPLRDMPLVELRCDFLPTRDTAILRSIKTLETINSLPASEFWKRVETGEAPQPPSPAQASETETPSGSNSLANPKTGEVRLLNLNGGVTLELVGIPPGEFMLGSTKEEQAWAVANGAKEEEVKREGEALRKATIKQGFWLGRTEVTVGQWKQFVKETGYVTDGEKKGEAYAPQGLDKPWGQAVKGASWKDPRFGAAPQDDQPVCCVSWNDAVAFCKWLTERERKVGQLPAGRMIRLPTEAEWEYACRAGTQTKFWWGDTKEDGKDRLNWEGMADGFRFVSPVDYYGARGRNRFGLADMLGNVYEWCLDAFDATGSHEEYYPATDTSLRVTRGGTCRSTPARTRSASRQGVFPSNVGSDAGFRVAVGVAR